MAGKGSKPQAAWWGEFSIQEGQRGMWRIGSLHLSVEHLPGEWLVAHHSTDDETDTSVAYSTSATVWRVCSQ